jgi:hypothetical protein
MRRSNRLSAGTMTEPDRSIDATELERRLSEAWRVEYDGEGVYGFADRKAVAGAESAGSAPACFSIQPAGDLWEATWKPPQTVGIEQQAISDQISGARERCLEWVVERAYSFEE